MTLKEFQEANCRGCVFADKQFVGTGKPCCTLPGKLNMVVGSECTRKKVRKLTQKKTR